MRLLVAAICFAVGAHVYAQGVSVSATDTRQSAVAIGADTLKHATTSTH